MQILHSQTFLFWDYFEIRAGQHLDNGITQISGKIDISIV